MNARTAACLVVAVLAAPAARADDPVHPFSTLAPGDRVRLEKTRNPEDLIATIESVTADEMVVRPAGTSESLRFDLSQLQMLEVARGTRTQWRKGAKIGFVPGFLFFGLVGGYLSCLENPDCGYKPGYGLVAGAIGGVATGAVGALVGLGFKTDRWVRVHETKARVSLMLAPVPGQTRFGMSVSF